jgi:hypothetical protein
MPLFDGTDSEVGATDILKLQQVLASQVGTGDVVDHDWAPNCHEVSKALIVDSATTSSAVLDAATTDTGPLEVNPGRGGIGGVEPGSMFGKVLALLIEMLQSPAARQGTTTSMLLGARDTADSCCLPVNTVMRGRLLSNDQLAS